MQRKTTAFIHTKIVIELKVQFDKALDIAFVQNDGFPQVYIQMRIADWEKLGNPEYVTVTVE